MLIYFKKFKLEVFIALSSIILYSFSKVIAAVISTNVLNSLIQLNIKKFLFYLLLELICWIIFAFFAYLMTISTALATQKMSLCLKEKIGQNISMQNYMDFHSKDTGDYSSWLSNDVTMIENNGFAKVFDLMTIISDTLISGVALIHYNWSLIITVCFLSFITVALPQILNKKIQLESVAVSTANEKFIAGINDLLRGFDTLYAFNMTQKLEQIIKKNGKVVKNKKVQLAKTTGSATSIAVLCNLLGQLGTQGWTGFLAIQRIVSIGSIFSTGTLASSIFNDLSQVGPVLNNIKSVKPLFKKYDLKSIDDSNKLLKINNNPNIDIKNMSFRYSQNEKPLFNNLSISIPFSSKVIISGESGCGKSTLLNIIGGKIFPYEGSIKIGNKELRDISTVILRKKIVYLDQIPNIFTGSIRYNLTLGEKFSDEELWEALNKSQLKDFVKKLDKGLDSFVGEKGQLFSGGQRQRLALARGLLRKPQILLIDEGTNSLSQDVAIQIEEQLVMLNDLTVIFVTHQLHTEVIKKFDQIIKL